MRRHKTKMAAGLVAGVATVLLHALFVGVAIWGGGGDSPLSKRPDAIGAGANTGRPDGDSAERRITVQLLTSAVADPQPLASDALLAERINAALKLEITGPDAVPLPPMIFQNDGEPAESSDAELMARTRMAGIYESQIRARIERAWTLPNDISEDPDFSCRALIRQQRSGRISEVELPYEGCGNSPALRQSLINAIFSASPLPAPPHPSVFVDSFSLELRAENVQRR